MLLLLLFKARKNVLVVVTAGRLDILPLEKPSLAVGNLLYFFCARYYGGLSSYPGGAMEG